MTIGTALDQGLSVRKTLHLLPNGLEIGEILQTSAVGLVIPSFVEDFGEGNRLDIVINPAHSAFQKGVPTAKPSGFYFEKKGIFKVQINVAANINVEMEDGEWKPIRSVYFSVFAKSKFTVNEKDPKNKTWTYQTKSLDIANMVIRDSEGEDK